jgi:hypothetical protein
MVEIRTSGDHAHRRDTIEAAQDALGESSMTKGVLAACEHTQMDVKRKRRALEYLEAHVAGEHVEKVAGLLSTHHVPIEYEAHVAVGVEADDP